MNAVQRPKPVEFEEDSATIPTFDARDLIAGGVQARLVLDGQCYFLRVTRAGKLILTK